MSGHTAGLVQELGVQHDFHGRRFRDVGMTLVAPVWQGLGPDVRAVELSAEHLGKCECHGPNR